jgi:hypothetical protein
MVQTLISPRRQIKLHIPRPKPDAESQAAWFADALALPDDRLVETLRRHIEAEYELEPGRRREAVLGRLRAWLRLGVAAHRLVAAYEKATSSLPRRYEMARLDAERDAVMNGMAYDEFRRLAEIVPWLRTWSVDFGEEGGQESRSERPAAPGAALIAGLS